MMKEKNIENQIKMYLRSLGFWCMKIQSGKMMKAYSYRKGSRQGMSRTHWIHLADEGTPDLLACIRGRFVAIEVKKDAKEIDHWRRSAETDRNSAAQHRQQEMIRDAGGVTLIVCSLDDLIADLKELRLLS